MAQVIIGAVGIVGLLLAVGAVAAQDLQCGDTLGPGGRFTLPADLLCATPIGLTVRDGATLDLGGHTVAGRETAVLLTGRGAVLEHGSAVGDLAAIQMAGDGWHTVRGVDTGLGGDRQDNGMVVLSDHNRLRDNIGSGLLVGFSIGGHHNQLVQNTGVGQAGFDVEGNENVLWRNRTNDTRACAICVSGHRNLVLGHEGRAGVRPEDASVMPVPMHYWPSHAASSPLPQ